MASKFFKIKPIPLHIQKYLIEQKNPSFSCSITKNVLRCEGHIQPTWISYKYKIRINLKLGYHPEVYVIEPKLVCKEGMRKIPHTYPGNKLCLYFPKANEWSGRMRIIDTILPWTAEWLVFYEVWQATDEWLGGGIDHQGMK